MLQILKVNTVCNVPYQPQWVGIEKTWGWMKWKFRQAMTELKVKNELFDTEEVVRGIAAQLTK